MSNKQHQYTVSWLPTDSSSGRCVLCSPISPPEGSLWKDHEHSVAALLSHCSGIKEKPAAGHADDDENDEDDKEDKKNGNFTNRKPNFCQENCAFWHPQFASPRYHPLPPFLDNRGKPTSSSSDWDLLFPVAATPRWRPSSAIHGKKRQQKKEKRRLKRIMSQAADGGFVLPEEAIIAAQNSLENDKISKEKAKAQQVGSLLRCVLAILRKKSGDDVPKEVHIVDFGGGTGCLALPLALMLPGCTVTIVDLKQKSLNYAEERSRSCRAETVARGGSQFCPSDAGGLANLRTWAGDIQQFREPFDIGVALHACGEATDLALERCLAVGASAVVAPCCVGKLRSDRSDPNTYIRKGCGAGADLVLDEKGSSEDVRDVFYPRSTIYKSILSTYGKNGMSMARLFNALASAGDYSERQDTSSVEGRVRRTAKMLLEWDRVMWLKSHGYDVKLCKMDPPEASPKNDIIIGNYCGKVREKKTQLR
uniref:Methyltransferase domain-containing protein n=1 Tax=Corethron hystrix TaxID=216773 RepID=A0A7S1BC49_9STRA|mmetsp:Transcript_21394/g.48599  ORF Transcript_21394/g.48599 Transcript_21394/m.48599 type:complete len:479 (+) Transcript_21394:31-1467(+)